MTSAEESKLSGTTPKIVKDSFLFFTNLKFLLSFVFLLLFAIGNFLVMHYEILHAEQNSIVLGFLEGQYGLVQKTSFLSLTYAQSIDYEERQNLRGTIHDELRDLVLFSTTSNDIASEKTHLPVELVRKIRRIYYARSDHAFSLNDDVAEYFSGLKKFLMGSPIRVRPDNPQLLAFQSKNTKLLVSLRESIKSFQRKSSTEVTFLKNIGTGLFALNLLCLTLIGFFVFLPTLKSLGVYLHRLKNINEALEIKVSERTAELEHKTRQLGLANDELREQIDERVRTEKTLRQTNAFLDSVIENIPDMVFIKDAEELRFVRFNRAGENLIGYSRESLLGKNDHDLFPKDEADFFTEKDRDALRKGALLEISEEPLQTRGKGLRILHTKKIPILNPEGKAIYLLGISEDITEKIQNEQRMREISLAMENALDGIARLDQRGQYLSVNKAYAVMLGYSPEELSGMELVSRICPEDADRIHRAVETMKEAGKAETEAKTTRKDGSIFHQYLVFVKNVDKDERFNGYYCFAKDVTEHKYQESLEIKAELIQMVSHELRTPIHSVKEGLSIVLEGLTGEITPEQKEVLGISKRCVDRLVRLVNDVLAFHKLEAGVVEFRMQKESLSQILKEVAASMRPLVENKDLFLKLELASNLPEVVLDHDKIVQVLTNFLQNAIKFTVYGGITISSALDAGGVKVSIKDTGIGIQQKDVPKLFRKFGQLESGKLTAPGGTGLGLAICKMIIEKHHGKIEMSSEYKKGSVFSFTLPLEQPKLP